MLKDPGSKARQLPGGKVNTRLLRWGMIAVTLLGMVALSIGGIFTVVQRASANSYNVTCPSSPCSASLIQTAINGASSGDTITVGPGTYTGSITVNKSVYLAGPNDGVDPVTGTRSAEAILDANGSSAATVTISTSNVTVTGFTIQGSSGGGYPSAGITAPSNAQGSAIEYNIITHNYNGILDLGGTGATIAVVHNWIYDNSSALFGHSCFGAGTTRCNGIFIGANFSSLVIEDNSIDESGLPAAFATHFQRAMSIDPSAQGTLTLSHNTLLNSSTLGNVTGSATNNDISGDFGIRLYGGVSDFTIAANTFSGLFSNAIVEDHNYNTNITITANTITQDIGDIQYDAGWVYGTNADAAIDLDHVKGAVTVTGNTVTYSGVYPSSAFFTNLSVVGIHIRSNATGAGVTYDISGNTLDGGNVGGADTAALSLDSGVALPSGSVNGNLFRRFTNGVNDSSVATYTLGSGNCITGNSSYGFSASGGAVNAQHNWWGSANGPSLTGPGTTIGYGNPVTSGTVDASSFLTSASNSACGGPVTSNVQSSVNPLPLGVPFNLTAKLDTTTTSNSPVHMAYYTLDGGAPIAMTTTSGTYDTSHTVDVTAPLVAFNSVGSHTLCVYGVDVYIQTGDPVCITLDVTTANTTTTVTSSDNPSLAGHSVTFTITVAGTAGTPTGSVTLKDGVTTLAGPLTLDGSGQATFTTSALTVGTHPITAEYPGDSSGSPIYAASNSSTLNQVVNLVSTTTAVTSSPNPSVSGQNVTFSVTVNAADSSTPTGTVTISDGVTVLGSITLSGGTGTFSDSSLSVGAHNITAAYSGDSTHDVSNGATTQTVNATPAVPTGAKNAYIRIVQASEEYTTSDIGIDGNITFPNVAACTAQAYYPIAAGNHTITVNNPSGGSTIITQSVSLTAGQYYTIAVVGSTAHSVTPALWVFQDDNSVTPNHAKVRVYHLSDTLGPVQVNQGSNVIAASLTFTNATGYNSYSPGSVAYSFQPTSGPAINDTLNVAANQVYSVFLMCNGQVTNTAATGIPTGLPQTGYGQQPWLNAQLIRVLLIVGSVLLVIGLGGLGSYFIVGRRREALQ
jgi:hypothetical protein